MIYKILRIDEQMYGCEEPPADQPILCDVLLESADGTRTLLPYPDEELTRLAIREGDTVELLNGKIAKL